MRQLTPIDAPTGSPRLPDKTPPAPLTAPERPRNPWGRATIFVGALLVIAAAGLAVLVGRGGGLPVTGDGGGSDGGGGGAVPDRGAATRLVAATMPDGAAFEPELVAFVGDNGARVDTAWSPAGTSLVCDVTADPPLPAERRRIAVATTTYSTSADNRQLTGRSERLTLTAVALTPAGAGRVLEEAAGAVAVCSTNPLSAMRDARLGSLPNIDGVVFRASHSDVSGDGPDPTVSCVIVRQDGVVLRSCGLSRNGDRADGLAVRGLGQLRVRLERALRDNELSPPADQARTPTWMRDPAVFARRDAYAPGCSLLTGDEVADVSGQRVVGFDQAACQWELAAGSVRLGPGGFGGGPSPAYQSVLRGNTAAFAEPGEGECVYKVATDPTGALRVSVTLTEPGRQPCAVARELLGLAFDRLPPA